MKKATAAASALVYLSCLIYCCYSLVHFGMIGNYALIWICPFLIQLACYLILFLKKDFSRRLAIFVTFFGALLSLPIFLLSLPRVIGWNLAIIAVSILSGVFLVRKSK